MLIVVLICIADADCGSYETIQVHGFVLMEDFKILFWQQMILVVLFDELQVDLHLIKQCVLVYLNFVTDEGSDSWNTLQTWSQINERSCYLKYHIRKMDPARKLRQRCATKRYVLSVLWLGPLIVILCNAVVISFCGLIELTHILLQKCNIDQLIDKCYCNS